jgi:hypothetical protein
VCATNMSGRIIIPEMSSIDPYFMEDNQLHSKRIYAALRLTRSSQSTQSVPQCAGIVTVHGRGL